MKLKIFSVILCFLLIFSIFSTFFMSINVSATGAWVNQNIAVTAVAHSGNIQYWTGENIVTLDSVYENGIFTEGDSLGTSFNPSYYNDYSTIAVIVNDFTLKDNYGNEVPDNFTLTSLEIYITSDYYHPGSGQGHTNWFLTNGWASYSLTTSSISSSSWLWQDEKNAWDIPYSSSLKGSTNSQGWYNTSIKEFDWANRNFVALYNVGTSVITNYSDLKTSTIMWTCGQNDSYWSGGPPWIHQFRVIDYLGFQVTGTERIWVEDYIPPGGNGGEYGFLGANFSSTVLGMIFLLLLFAPAIVMGEFIPKIGFPVGLMLMLTIINFTSLSFNFLGYMLIGWLNIGVIYYKGVDL